MKKILILSLLMMIAACQSLSPTTWELKTASNVQGVSIAQVKTRVLEGQLEVSGVVQSSRLAAEPQGKVIVRILQPGQAKPVLAQVEELTRLSNRHHHRLNRKSFSARFDGVPSPGTQIEVQYVRKAPVPMEAIYKL